MKREVLFRGFNSISNKWEYGSLVKDNSGNYSIFNPKFVERDGHHVVETSDKPMFFDQDKIGEFIGKNDDNENKIFEHDIVEVLPDGFLSEKDTELFVVLYFNGDFRLFTYSDITKYSYYEDFYDLIGYHGKINVVGNIFDNPEMVHPELMKEIKEKYI